MRATLTLYVALCTSWCLGTSLSDKPSLPNIVFLLTDDQDFTANSLDYMPHLNRLMRDEGMEFLNAFVSTALCCPSRSTILRGQFCHNTKIYDNGDLNNKTYLSGGYTKFKADKLEKSTIATQLREAGYETFFIGKYLNDYTDDHAQHVPEGWHHWWGLTDHSYFGPHFSEAGKLVRTSSSTYQTDFISATSQNLLMSRNKDKPFFIYIAPFAPHVPAQPAPRHAHLFTDVEAPRYPSFNPDEVTQQQKPSWIKRMPLLHSDQIRMIDGVYKNCLRALQSVDELLESITILLEQEGIDDNTFIFYMADNGKHYGDFRLPVGKRQAYDTDIRVPFLVRGPGVRGGTKVSEVVMSVDLFPTWIELAGAEMPNYDVDGKSITPLLFAQISHQPQVNAFRSAALVEMYGSSSAVGMRYKGMPVYEMNKFWNNTYQAVRVINGSDWAANADWLYTEWCTGEREFYNVSSDRHQIYNLIHAVSPTLLQQLSVLTESLGNCSGKSCTDTDYKKIARVAEQAGDVALKRRLHCFNPPDMPGKSLDPGIWDMVERDPAYCEVVLANGFPYADSDIIPERVLALWNSCVHGGNFAQNSM